MDLIARVMEAVGVVNVGGGECGIIETFWFEHIKNRFVGLRDNVTDMLHQNYVSFVFKSKS